MLNIECDRLNSLSFENHLDSLFYARCKSGRIIWKSSTRFRMRNNVPQPGLMRRDSIFMNQQTVLMEEWI
jgi:hypothetical protein